jgi:hypothetical protein
MIGHSEALYEALKAIVEFCDDPNGSEKPPSLAVGMSRLLRPARAALRLAREGDG